MVFVIVITSRMSRFLVTLLAKRVGLKPKMMKHGSLFSWLVDHGNLGSLSSMCESSEDMSSLDIKEQP